MNENQILQTRVYGYAVYPLNRKGVNQNMARLKRATLRDIARIMKYEAYISGKSERKLAGGLHLALETYEQGWKLKIGRDDTAPSKNDYRVIAKAFFNRRVAKVSQPSKNVLELTTVKGRKT